MGVNRKKKSVTGRGKSTRDKTESHQARPAASTPARLVVSKRAGKPAGRKRSEKKPASSESKLRALFAAMQDVVLIIDKEGIYREIAPTNPNPLYKPSEEMQGKSLHEVFPPRTAEQFMAIIGKVLATQQLKQIEYQLKIGESIFWFLTNITPLDTDLTVWVAHDISNRKAAEETLRQSEANYRSLFENIPDGIYRTAPDGQILSANPALVRMFGYEDEKEFKLRYRADQMYSNPADREKFLQKLEEQNEFHNSEIILKRKDGSPLIALENAHVVQDEKGKALYYEGVLTDITERKRMEDTLRESEAFSQAILNNSPIGISVRSRTGRLLSANEAWKKIWAMPESEVEEDAAYEQSALKFDASDDYLGAHQVDVRRVYEQGGYLHLPELKTIRARPGAAEWISQHFYAIQDANGQVDRVVILTEDITERKRAEIALRLAKESAEVANFALQQTLEREMVLSRTDSLTEVFNRRYFFEFANHEFAMAKRYQRSLSMVMFDIDNFKQFNDTYGHQAGDEILKRVAQITRQQLRGTDIPARYGGDEFVILLSNSNAQEAVIAGERIRESIAAYLLEMKGRQVNITISMGIAECLNEIDTIDQLVQHADKALYDAKYAGRNRVIVYRDRQDKI